MGLKDGTRKIPPPLVNSPCKLPPLPPGPIPPPPGEFRPGQIP